MKRNYHDEEPELTPEERAFASAVFAGCGFIIFLFALLMILVMALWGYSEKRNQKLQGEEQAVVTAPSGKIYHSGDTVDLNDFLKQYDSEVDWNATDSDPYTDSVLVSYGIYHDSDKVVWLLR